MDKENADELEQYINILKSLIEDELDKGTEPIDVEYLGSLQVNLRDAKEELESENEE